MSPTVDKNPVVDVDASLEAQRESEASSSRIHENDFVTQNEERDLSRGLHQRHISLIAIAGAIVRDATRNLCLF